MILEVTRREERYLVATLLRRGLTIARSTILTFFESPIILAFAADVIRGSSRIPELVGQERVTNPKSTQITSAGEATIIHSSPQHPILNKLLPGPSRRLDTGHKMQTVSVVFSTLHC